MSLRGGDWLSADSENDVSDFRSRWSVQNPITPPPHTVLNHLALFLLRVPGFAGGTDHGPAGGVFGDGAAVGEVLLVLGFVDALLVHHHALGRGAGGGEQGGEGDQGLREAGRQPALIDGESAGQVVSKPVIGVDQH